MVIKVFVLLLSLFQFSFASDSYYHKGKLVELQDKVKISNKTLGFTKDGKSVQITNKIVLKTNNNFSAEYFVAKYPVKYLSGYGKVMVFEVDDIKNVLAVSKEIYENENVLYSQPSFVKKIKRHNLVFDNISSSTFMKTRILPHSSEDTKSMLDSDNSVNYYKYFDDVFRYEDESFWHMHNKGGFVTQANYGSESHEVVSVEDIDSNILNVIDQNITGKNVKVLVVDSSFEQTHPDLHFSSTYNLALNNKDVSPNSTADFHGTAVAGIIGANRGNNYGIMGVASDAYMIAFNGLFEIDEDTMFTQSYISIFYKALEENVDVINCSWTTLDMLDEASEDAINTFVKEARDGKGGFVVVSSGNEGSTSLSNEASLQNVISVGSIEADGERSAYSNFGPKLDLVAPSNFVSLDLLKEDGFEENEMGFVAGTSFSAPIVSGIIALLLEVNPDITRDKLLNILYSTTKHIGTPEINPDNQQYTYEYMIDEDDKYNVFYKKSKYVGYGLVDAQAAVEKVKETLVQEDVNRTIDDLSSVLNNLKHGWNFIGTAQDVNDLSLFEQVSIVWIYTDDTWMGYSPILEYAQELRRQDKLLSGIPKNSGLWVYTE